MRALAASVTRRRLLSFVAVLVYLVIGVGAAAAIPAGASPNPATAPTVTAATVTAAPTVAAAETPSFEETAADRENLPAWRWDRIDLYTNFGGITEGLSNAPAAILSTIAGLLFTMAGIVWMALRELLAFGLTASPVEAAAHTINQAFASLAGPLAGNSVLLLIAVPALLVIARQALKSNVQGVIRGILIFAIPLALLQGVMSAAAADSNSDTPGQEASARDLPVGSPAWFGVQGISFVDSIGGVITGVNVNAFNSNVWADSPEPACQTYSDALYDRYSNTASADSSLIAVSRLWERGFADNWAAAMFGESYGKRVGCMYLEHTNNVPPTAQREVALEAGWGSFGAGEPGLGPFTIRDGVKRTTSDTFAWAACTWNGGWAPSPGFDALKGSDADAVDNALDWAPGDFGQADTPKVPIDAEVCSTWWSSPGEADDEPRLNNGEDPALEWSDPGQVSDNTRVEGNETPEQQEGLRQIDQSINTFWGYNTFDRLLRSAVALITALVYMWGLGAVAIGSIIAQIGLVIMLILLPLTLILLALPNKNGGRNPLGVRLLKMTIGFLAAKLVLLVGVSILVQLILLIDGVMRSLAGGLGWLVAILAPIAAIWLLKLIASRLGMGNMFSLSGGLSMASSIAYASGDPQGLKAGMRKDGLRSLLGDTPFDKLDSAEGRMRDGGRELAKSGWGGVKDRISGMVGGSGPGDDSGALGKLVSGGAPAGGSSGDGSVLGQVRDATRSGAIATLGGAAATTPLARPSVMPAKREDFRKLSASAASARAAIAAADPSQRSKLAARRAEEIQTGLLAGGAAATGLAIGHVKNGLQLDAERAAYANRYGLDADAVAASHELLSPVIGGALSVDSVDAMDDAQVSSLLAEQPWLYFDDKVLERAVDESDTDYVRRMHHVAVESGFMTPDGQALDVAKAYGLSVEAQRRILTGDRGVVKAMGIGPEISLSSSVTKASRRLGSSQKALAERLHHRAAQQVSGEVRELAERHAAAVKQLADERTAVIASFGTLAHRQAALDAAVRSGVSGAARVDLERAVNDARRQLADARHAAAEQLHAAHTQAASALYGEVLDAIVSGTSAELAATAQAAEAAEAAMQHDLDQALHTFDQLLSADVLLSAVDNPDEAVARVTAMLDEQIGNVVNAHRAGIDHEVTRRSSRRTAAVTAKRSRDLIVVDPLT